MGERRATHRTIPSLSTETTPVNPVSEDLNICRSTASSPQGEPVSTIGLPPTNCHRARSRRTCSLELPSRISPNALANARSDSSPRQLDKSPTMTSRPRLSTRLLHLRPSRSLSSITDTSASSSMVASLRTSGRNRRTGRGHLPPSLRTENSHSRSHNWSESGTAFQRTSVPCRASDGYRQRYRCRATSRAPISPLRESCCWLIRRSRCPLVSKLPLPASHPVACSGSSIQY